MTVEVAMCRVGNKVIRHLIAASVEELNALDGLHAGLPAYVTGTGAFQWDGEAWVAGGGGSVGPQGPAGAAGATVACFYIYVVFNNLQVARRLSK